jgi:anaerobic magnesium-protoporphyrin IX monomethyl ester cyclase
VKLTLVSPYSDITSYGLRCLSSYLKSFGHEVIMIFLPDYREEVEDKRNTDDLYLQSLMEEVARQAQGSGLIGISLMTYCFQRVAQLTDYLKAQLSVPIIWGGIHATIRPEECLAHADYACRGEGEESLAKLVAALEANESVSEVPNLVFQRDGRVVLNPVAPLVQKLDVFPRPDYDLTDHFYALLGQPPLKPMDPESFEKLMAMNPLSDPGRGEIVYQTMSSRGCPYHCAYCCNNFLRQLYAKQKYVRFLEVETIIGELKDIKARFPFLNTVLFSDDSFFSAPTRWLEHFARRYAAEVGLPFRCLASPLAITEAKLALLTGAGLRGLQIGIQSGSERTRRQYQREGSSEAVIRAGQIVAQFIPPIDPPKYDIILDNPYETMEDLQDTIYLMRRLPPPYQVQPFSLVFIPGTDLHTKALRDGLIQDEQRQIYRKQFHVAGNIYFKFLMTLAGGHRSTKWLSLLGQPFLLKFFNRPTILKFLGKVRSLKMALSVRRRTASLGARSHL